MHTLPPAKLRSKPGTTRGSFPKMGDSPPVRRVRNHLYIYSGITNEVALDARVKLGKIVRNKRFDEVHIHINSSGGDMDAGFALTDALINSPKPVYTYADGKVYSSAFLIYLAGAKRFAHRFSSFLAHTITCTSDGGFRVMYEDMRALRISERRYVRFVRERTRIPRREITGMMSGVDRVFWLPRAQAYGVVNTALAS